MATILTNNQFKTTSQGSEFSPGFNIEKREQANPFAQEIIRPALEEEKKERDDLLKWRDENSKKIQKHLLDFDNFEPNQPLESRKEALIRSFMDVEHDVQPEDTEIYAIHRDQIANKLFEGKGAGDNNAFFDQIKNLAQTRKDRSEFDQSLVRSAVLDKLSGGKSPYKSWAGETAKHAGRQEYQDGRYLEAWKAAQERIEEKYGHVLPEVNQMYNYISGAGGEHQVDNVATFYYQLSEEERPLALGLLKMAAQGLSEEKKATFLSNLSKQAGRDVSGLGTSVKDGFKAYTLYASGGAMFNDQGTIAQAKMERGESGFRKDVERILEQDFDPVKHLFPEGTWKGSAERAAYATPGVLASSALAITPVVGQMAIFNAMEEDAYQEYRHRFMQAGMSEKDAMEQASNLSIGVGAAQAALERVGGRAIMGKFPVLDKALTRFSDKITSRALRYTTKTGIMAAQETVTESLQDLTLEFTQDIASALNEDVPEVNWDKVFDGYGHKTLTTFLAILPLSMAGAGINGFKSSRRNKIISEASDLELQVYGASAEAIQEMRNANGPASLSKAVTNLITNADPRSEEAMDATQELAEKIQRQKELEADAVRAGAMPRLKVNDKGIELIDPEDGKVIGVAQNADEAVEMMADHSHLSDRMGQNRIDYLKSMIEGAEFTREQDGNTRSTTLDLRLDEVTTVAQAAAESSQNAERTIEQLRIKEQLNGGDGSIANLVWGQSQTEFEGKQRKTLNRLNGGASILTVFHEDAHGLYREALQTGRLTKDETIDFFRAVDSALDGKTTKEGKAIRFLADGEVSDTMLDEAVAEFAEVEILRTRKGKKDGIGSVINRNLSSIARTVPGAHKFKAFVDAMRKFFEVALVRHLHIKRSIADGTLDESKLDDFRAKLQGTSAQEEFQGEVDYEYAELTNEQVEANENFVPTEDVPFSIEQRIAATEAAPTSYSISPTQNDNRISFSLGAPVASLTGNEFQKIEGVKLDEQVTAYLIKEGKQTVNHPEVGEIVIDKEGFKSSISKGLGRKKSATFMALPDVLEKGEVVEESENWKERGYDTVVLAAPVEIAEKEHVVFAIVNKKGVKDPKGKNKYHVHEVVTVSRKADGSFQVPNLPRRKNSTEPSDIERVAQKFFESKKNENGNSYSLGNSAIADALISDISKRVKNPETRVKIMADMARRVEALKRDTDVTKRAFGKEYTQKALVEEKTKKQITEEAKTKFPEKTDKAKRDSYIKDEVTKQQRDHNKPAKIRRSLATLDALLMALPPELRGKVGGYTQLAKLDSDQKRLDYLLKKLDKLDQVVEKWQKKEITKQIDKLNERAKAKRKSGKKPTGGLGGEGHRYFDHVDKVIKLDADHTNAQIKVVEEKMVETEAIDDLANLAEHWQILQTFGDFKNKSAKELQSAYETLNTVYKSKRNAWRTKEEARLEGVRDMIKVAVKAIGGKGAKKTQAAKQRELKALELIKAGSWSMKSFTEVLESVFGKDSELTKKWSGEVRRAMHNKTTRVIAAQDRFTKALQKATGLKGRASRMKLWEMTSEQTIEATEHKVSTQEIKVPIDTFFDAEQNASLGLSEKESQQLTEQFKSLPKGSTKKYLTLERINKKDGDTTNYSEAEAIYLTMLYRQEGYQKAMEAHGMGAKFQQQIEKGMSDASKSMRDFLQDEYRDNYEPLRKVYERMFGVDLPSTKNYTPGSFYFSGEEAMLDVKGGFVEGGLAQGFLKDRKKHMAKPKPEAAFDIFFAHLNQTEHWQAMAEISRELHGVLNSAEVKEALAGKSENAAYVVSTWLKAIDGNGLNTHRPGKVMSFLLQSQAYIALSWKIGTTAKNFIGASINAAYRMGPVELAKGYGRLMTGKLDLKGMFDTDLIQNRLKGGFSPEVRAAISKSFGAKPTRRAEFLNQGMEIIGYADGFATAMGAAITYDYNARELKKNMPNLSESQIHEMAMDEAADTISRTAQPVEVTDRSLLELGLGSFGKVPFVFASEARQKSAMWIGAAGNALKWKATKEDRRVLLVSHLIVAPIMHATSMMLRDMRDGEDDELFDDKYWSAGDFFWASLTGPLAGMPLIRDIVDGYNGESTPLTNMANAGKSSLDIIEELFTDEEIKSDQYEKKILDIMKGLSPSTGVGANIYDQANDIRKKLFGDD